MEKKKLDGWAAVISHTHTRLGRLLPSDSMFELEANRHDGQCSVEAFRSIVSATFGENTPIVDTDHPVHVLDYLGLPRTESFKPEVIHKTKRLISEGVLKRCDTIRSNPELAPIYTGVEVDILNANGIVDVDNDTLSILDFVIASHHYRFWKAYNERPPTNEELIDSYIATILNNRIHSLGHPMREIQPLMRKSMNVKSWDNLLHLMRETNTAFELNLCDLIPTRKVDELSIEVIRRAANSQVGFVLGADFHDFAHFGSKYPERQFIDIDNVPEVITTNNQAKIRFYRQLLQIEALLTDLGITGERIINNSASKFDEWIKRK